MSLSIRLSTHAKSFATLLPPRWRKRKAAGRVRLASDRMSLPATATIRPDPALAAAAVPASHGQNDTARPASIPAQTSAREAERNSATGGRGLLTGHRLQPATRASDGNEARDASPQKSAPAFGTPGRRRQEIRTPPQRRRLKRKAVSASRRGESSKTRWNPIKESSDMAA